MATVNLAKIGIRLLLGNGGWCRSAAKVMMVLILWRVDLGKLDREDAAEKLTSILGWVLVVQTPLHPFAHRVGPEGRTLQNPSAGFVKHGLKQHPP